MDRWIYEDSDISIACCLQVELNIDVMISETTWLLIYQKSIT